MALQQDKRGRVKAHRGERLRHRGRSALVWAFAFFLVSQVGLAAAISCGFPDLGEPFYGARLARLHSLLQCDTPADGPAPLVLMLGSSRTAYGLDAAWVERALTAGRGGPVRVFNFGTLGAGPITERLYLQRLLDDGTRPDLLLVEVMPPLLAGQLAEPAEARHFPASSRLRGRELALLGRFGFPLDELRRTRRLSWTVPAYAHRSALLSRLCAAWLPYGERLDWAWSGDAHGWSAQEEALPPEQYRQSVRVEARRYAAALDHFRTDGAPAQALRELLAVCRARRVPAALVLMPEGSEFRRWYPADAQTKLDRLLDELRGAYGVTVIDARRWVADEDFFDAHHLRACGAAAFSDRLRKEIEDRRLLRE